MLVDPTGKGKHVGVQWRNIIISKHDIFLLQNNLVVVYIFWDIMLI